MLSVPRLALFLAGIALLSCDWSAAPESAVTVIRVEPESALVSAGSSHAFRAVGLNSTGGVVALGPVVWTVEPPGAATVTSAGLVTGVRGSGAMIKATSGAVSGLAKFVVLPTVRYSVITANDSTLPFVLDNAPCIPALPGKTAPLSVTSGHLEFGLRLSGSNNKDTVPVAELWLDREQDCSIPPSSFGHLDQAVLKGQSAFLFDGYVFRFVDGSPGEEGILFADSLSFTQNDGSLPITWRLRLKVLP